MESFFQGLQRFGIGRLAAILGAAAGVASVLAAIILHISAQPQALLYSNLDLKEASEITTNLDQSGIKYEAKGDGSTIMVERDQVAKARMMLASKGLPTAASVGYEIFDKAPPLGQTDFVQNLENQRALEGELARTIGTLHGISSARVHLVMPKRDLFEEQASKPTASVVVGLSGPDLTPDQVRAIRNLIAGAVPNLKADDVTLLDNRNHLLAAGGQDDSQLDGAGMAHKSEVEETLRKRILNIVEGVVGPGAARVMVTADLDPTSTTKEDVQFNPDGQVVRSTQTTEANDKTTQPDSNGLTTAAANIPGGAQPNGVTTSGTQSGQNSETTNYEISNTKTTTVTGPGELKKLAVAVVVDDIVIPSKDGKTPDGYQVRPAADIQKINDLVRAGIGIDDQRGDTFKVTNIRFNHDVAGALGGTAAKPSLFDFDKNDIMRALEVAVLFVVALLTIFLIARPLLKFISSPPSYLAVANSGGQLAMAAGAPGSGVAAMQGLAAQPGGASIPYQAAEGGVAAVPYQEQDARIDIARIEGQVRASSVKKVSEFVDRHPEESLSILRGWLHDS